MADKNSNIMICRCEDQTLEDIHACISGGCRTIDEIKRVTRAGMGACQGRTCTGLIAAELSKYYNIPVEDILMPTFRPPVKSVTLGALADALNKDSRNGK